MARLSSDGSYVIVEKGDTLSAIAKQYGKGKTYQQLAAINNIADPDFILIDQKIYLSKESASGSTANAANTNKPRVTHFGLQSNADDTLFAAWTWNKSNTKSYKVLWSYDTGDGVWFQGSNSTIEVDDDAPQMAKKSTYSIPKNAKKVQFKVKPISKTYKKNDEEVNYWEASWSDTKQYTIKEAPPDAPSAPSVEIEKYKLTATLDNLTMDATGIEFQIVKNNAASVFKSGKASITSGHASFACNVDAGGEYKVRCRAYKGSLYSEWSPYSNNEGTIPSAPTGIVTIQATSDTSIYLAWEPVSTATSYELQYSNELGDFDNNDKPTNKPGIDTAHWEVTGLETGLEYFFRVRACNDKGESGWSLIKSIVIGKLPAAPTTWSSTTTAIVGELLTLYWVHNTEDGSSQTKAKIELIIGGVTYEKDWVNPAGENATEEEKNKTAFYEIDTSVYDEGTTIQWRVCTAGITGKFGDWSIQRTIDIYDQPSVELLITDVKGNALDLEAIDSLPFYARCKANPLTQMPISWHVSITSKDIYETIDSKGNPKTVNAGEEVYSKYFDASLREAVVSFSASNVTLEHNANYRLTVVAAMDSGLTAESSVDFTTIWADTDYIPNAEIGIDSDTLTASIRPYCSIYESAYHKVTYDASARGYVVSSEVIDSVYGSTTRYTTTTGERVYSGTTADGESVYYCLVENNIPVTDVLLSVYRREFDGSLTELITDLDGAKGTTITDPHPALDLARYRIVAASKATGAISYYDPPGYPVGGKAVIIQWDENCTSFDTTEESALEQPVWSGSMLKLPYNIDVSDNHNVDVSLVEYIGRSHPVSYYGTQVGETSTWNMDIIKSDKETLYGLRRLARWMGDVYVREPSGSGYWANISVSFSQKHRELTIPVTLNITRVEGGA